MKTMELSNYGVVEMNQVEMMNVDGGMSDGTREVLGQDSGLE